MRAFTATALIACLFAAPAMAQDGEGMTFAPIIGASLTDKVWVLDQGDDATSPGTMMVLLSDGTMIMDSCWETYRLNAWRMVSDETIAWDEDTATTAEQHYSSAPVPFLCPDMPR